MAIVINIGDGSGEPGPAGPKGDTGPAGPPGPPGDPGTSTWFSGDGPPPTFIPGASAGDMYYDQNNGDLYQL